MRKCWITDLWHHCGRMSPNESRRKRHRLVHSLPRLLSSLMSWTQIQQSRKQRTRQKKMHNEIERPPCPCARQCDENGLTHVPSSSLDSVIHRPRAPAQVGINIAPPRHTCSDSLTKVADDGSQACSASLLKVWTDLPQQWAMPWRRTENKNLERPCVEGPFREPQTQFRIHANNRSPDMHPIPHTCKQPFPKHASNSAYIFI